MDEFLSTLWFVFSKTLAIVLGLAGVALLIVLAFFIILNLGIMFF